MTIALWGHPLSFAADPHRAAAAIAAAGVAEVRLAYSYHSGRWLATTSDPGRVLEFGAGVWFPPDPQRYADTSLRPMPRQVHLTGAASAALTHAGVRVCAWTVALHQGRLAASRPDLAVRNAFGHPYRHALCPAQPEVRAYVAGLVADIAAQPHVARVELEACGFLGWAHDGAHDKTGAALRPADRWLLSLCLCTACGLRFGAAGLDPEELAGDVRALVRAQLQSPAVSGELGRLVGADRLAAVHAVRDRVTTGLLGAAVAAAGATPVSLRVTADRCELRGKTTGPLRVLAGLVDELTVTNFAGDAAALHRDVEAATATGTPVCVGWSLSPAHSPSWQQLSDVAAYGGRVGVYAYDLMPADRLDWLARLANRQPAGTS